MPNQTEQGSNMDTRSPVDQNALASVLQQAISNALALALDQQTQLLAQTIETGFQRMTLASAAHSEASRPVDRSSPPEQQHQSFEQLFGVNNRPNFETNQDAPPIVSSPFGSQQNRQSKVSIDDFLYRNSKTVGRTMRYAPLLLSESKKSMNLLTSFMRR
ncbi:hypothetical protein ACLKA6_002188 [Drosophila palustris]